MSDNFVRLGTRICAQLALPNTHKILPVVSQVRKAAKSTGWLSAFVVGHAPFSLPFEVLFSASARSNSTTRFGVMSAVVPGLAALSTVILVCFSDKYGTNITDKIYNLVVAQNNL